MASSAVSHLERRRDRFDPASARVKPLGQRRFQIAIAFGFSRTAQPRSNRA
jgi:hypothetical protein